MPRQIFLLSLNKLLISTSFLERLSNRAPSLLLREVWARSRHLQLITRSQELLTGNVQEYVDQELGYNSWWSFWWWRSVIIGMSSRYLVSSLGERVMAHWKHTSVCRPGAPVRSLVVWGAETRELISPRKGERSSTRASWNTPGEGC